MEEPKLMYQERFPLGGAVRIKDTEHLERFYREWKYHHPLQAEQLQYAGRMAKVANVSFYHGCDVLYILSDVPGIWHEECLEEIIEKRCGSDLQKCNSVLGCASVDDMARRAETVSLP